MHDQVISIVGVGGLGSIIAEHLIHMGFHEINLIDPDVLEVSNLNRVVGAYYEDAQQKRYKVDVVKRHLTTSIQRLPSRHIKMMFTTRRWKACWRSLIG